MGTVQRVQATTEDVVAGLKDVIVNGLRDNGTVMWLISGGSSIPVAIAVSERLVADGIDTAGLFATLVDDIYEGRNDEGHNWQRLVDEGFIAPQGGVRGIERTEQSIEDDAAAFEQLLQQKLTASKFVVGQFGIGGDFHTGGIAPASAAAREQSRLAVGYVYNDQEKITITPALIARLDIAFVNSMGESKRQIVAHFLESEASPEIEPAQNLKAARQTLLYSDVL